MDSNPSRTSHRVRFAVVGVIALVYLASSSGFLLAPSPHFHFVDMAASWLDGRLDTVTPRRRGGVPARPEDRPGLQEAIDRATDNGRSGWNDWASYRVLVLRGGEEVRGVFPYKDVPGPRQHEFWTVDGKSMIIDPMRDLATGCDPERPAGRCDRVVYYVSFPPMPAVVMLPFVALFGYHTHDVWITLLLALIGPWLLLAWLDRLHGQGLMRHSVRDRVWLVMLFSLGTAIWYCSIRGTVWFSALALGVPLHLGYLMAAQGARRPMLAGLLLGMGVATRTPLLFGAIFLPLEALFPGGRWLGGRGRDGAVAAARAITHFGLPLAAIGAALAWYNWARWQNPLEFGHFYLLEGTRAPTRDFGLFNFHFLNHNLSAALTNLPKLVPNAPFVLISRHGLGLLASTPALWALLRAPPAALELADPLKEAGEGADTTTAPVNAADDPVREAVGLSRNLLLTVLAIAIPGLLYQNDGWQQFAYRFSVDFWPPLLGVFALRVGAPSRRVKVLICIAIAVQLFGAVTFGRLEQFYYD